jgi:hypothetical protein
MVGPDDRGSRGALGHETGSAPIERDLGSSGRSSIARLPGRARRNQLGRRRHGNVCVRGAEDRERLRSGCRRQDRPSRKSSGERRTRSRSLGDES